VRRSFISTEVGTGNENSGLHEARSRNTWETPSIQPVTPALFVKLEIEKNDGEGGLQANLSHS
jgi:hypothetical protein